MKLALLDPRFLRYEEREAPDGFGGAPTLQIVHVFVDTIAEAQGVIFLCPKCFKANNGPVGTHSVMCWSSSRGVPERADPKPGRWALEGTGLHDLTLGCEPGKSRSILLTSGCQAHFYVTNGDAHD